MTGLPAILTSAQALFQDGTARLDGAGNQIVGAAASDAAGQANVPGAPGSPDSAELRPQLAPGNDPIAAGLVEMIRAQVEVSAGAALVHAYNRSMDDLFRMLDPGTQR